MMMGLLATLLLLNALPARAAEPLGRLFFTPERREALDRNRALNQQQELTIQSAQVSVNGVVTRSDGRKTVWLNHRAYHDNASAGDVAARATDEAARVHLQVGQAIDTTLKVGQSVDRNSGATEDLLGGGSVAVRKPLAPRSPR